MCTQVLHLVTFTCKTCDKNKLLGPREAPLLVTVPHEDYDQTCPHRAPRGQRTD